MADLTVPRADFSPLSSLFGNYLTARRARQTDDVLAARGAALDALPKRADGSPDFAAGSLLLLRNGDHQGAAMLASLARSTQRRHSRRQASAWDPAAMNGASGPPVDVPADGAFPRMQTVPRPGPSRR